MSSNCFDADHDKTINKRNSIDFDFFLYSIGLTIYFLLFGKLPFSFYSIKEFNNLLTQPKNIEVKIDKDKNLQDLVNKILKKKKYERISFEEYFQHKFFEQYKY